MHTQRTIERDLAGCVNDLRAIGVGTPAVHVWSGNATGGSAGQAVASKYFDAARSDHEDSKTDVGVAGLNDTPLNWYSLAGTSLNMGGTSLTRDQWLNRIQDDNLLGIAYLHVNDNIQAEEDQIDTFLSDATSKDLDILTFEEAISRFQTNAKPRQQHRVPETGRRLWLSMAKSASTVFDASGWGNDASWTGTASYTVGPLGRAAKITGDTDYLTVSDDASIDPGTGDFSIVVEFETRDTAAGYLLRKWFSGEGGYRLNIHPQGKLSFFLDDTSNNKNFSREFWMDGMGDTIQVAIVRDTGASELRMYINGSHDREEHIWSDPTGDVSSTYPLDIGEHSAVDFNLYDLQIFNRAVDREELQAWHLQSLPGGIKDGPSRWYDDSWTEQMHMDPGNNQMLLSNSGAKLFVNGSGEVVVEDEAGNTTTIS
jgi:hypothetical protein